MVRCSKTQRSNNCASPPHHTLSRSVTPSCHHSTYFRGKSNSECRAPMSCPNFVRSIFLSCKPCLSCTSSFLIGHRFGILSASCGCIVHEARVILLASSSRRVLLNIVDAEINVADHIGTVLDLLLAQSRQPRSVTRLSTKSQQRTPLHGGERGISKWQCNHTKS